MNEAVKKFILLVEAHFPRAKFSGDEAKEAIWLRSMSEILGDYSEDVLAEASMTILRTRDPEKQSTMFPKPAECIKVCEAIRLRKTYESNPLFSTKSDEVKAIAAPQNLPSIVVMRGEPAWDDWMRHFEGVGKKDVAQAADALGYVRASSRWPRSDSVVFEPKQSGQYAFAQLRAMN